MLGHLAALGCCVLERMKYQLCRRSTELMDVCMIMHGKGRSSRVWLFDIDLPLLAKVKFRITKTSEAKFPGKMSAPPRDMCSCSLFGCFQKWGYPKMDGENNGKPYFLMDDLGIPLFLETPICSQRYCRSKCRMVTSRALPLAICWGQAFRPASLIIPLPWVEGGWKSQNLQCFIEKSLSHWVSTMPNGHFFSAFFGCLCFRKFWGGFVAWVGPRGLLEHVFGCLEMVRNGVDDARAVPSVFLRVSVAELASFKSRFPLADTKAGVQCTSLEVNGLCLPYTFLVRQQSEADCLGMNGCHLEPPRDVAHMQFRSRPDSFSQGCTKIPCTMEFWSIGQIKPSSCCGVVLFSFVLLCHLLLTERHFDLCHIANVTVRVAFKLVWCPPALTWVSCRLHRFWSLKVARFPRDTVDGRNPPPPGMYKTL